MLNINNIANAEIVFTISDAMAELANKTWTNIWGKTHRDDDYYEYVCSPKYQGADAVVKGVNSSKNYRIGYITDKTKSPDNPFGFIEDAFISGKYLKINLKDYTDKVVIVKISQGDKGYRVNAIEYFTPNGCYNLMGDYFEKFCEIAAKNYYQVFNKRVLELEEREKRHQEHLAAEAKREAEIVSLVGNYKVENEYSRTNYGGAYKATFIFNSPINEETFKQFLSLKRLIVEAKPCYYPICPETVRFYSYNGGIKWNYEWHGEWDD